MFILGRIKAAQLEYSEAHKHLVQAIRKAPQHAAVGFKQTVSSSVSTFSEPVVTTRQKLFPFSAEAVALELLVTRAGLMNLS